ncbi:hypothetical protein E0Z10_g8846, partial [Xylaria hypoxylon]
MSYSTVLSPEELPAGSFVTRQEQSLLCGIDTAVDVDPAPFPTTRRPQPRELIPESEVSADDVEKWFGTTGVHLGPQVPDHLKDDVMRTFYTYRDLNASSILDMQPTDLSKRKFWTVPQKYWLHRLVQEGIDAGMYESTIAANGKLSDWAGEPVLVDKNPESPNPLLEPRLTFNYGNVDEDMPATSITLLEDVHEHLSDPRIGSFSLFDLKHGYWVVPIHPPDRYVFAFSIPGFPQLQPTRMPQGSQTAGFSFTELMAIAMGALPEPNAEGSFLSPPTHDGLTELSYYIDDIFVTHETFEEQWTFIKERFFPRLDWALFKLSFKKVFLGCDQILALGVTHHTHGIMTIKPERSEKLSKWPVPKSQTDVRAFLGAIGPTRRWIKNCAEISRPLTRLTGNVPWQWTDAEALSFSILRSHMSGVLEIHGHRYDYAVKAYTDASGYGAGLLITQTQEKVDVPLVYDSFLFNKPQRSYGTYKRELLAIVEFTRRHVRFFINPPGIRSIVYTDHKPLTFFLDSIYHEGIYARWVSELRSINIIIMYIKGERNKTADALSRTIFPDESCEDMKLLSEFGEVDSEGSWVWKDGSGGYQELIERISAVEAESLLAAGDKVVNSNSTCCFPIVWSDESGNLESTLNFLKDDHIEPAYIYSMATEINTKESLGEYFKEP